MAITVKLIGALRHISGNKQLSVSCEKAISVLELINKISKEVPELKPHLINQQPDDSKANALVLVNGKEISVLNGLETRLKDCDEVIFIPVIHGG